jgi:hypothetical protein
MKNTLCNRICGLGRSVIAPLAILVAGLSFSATSLSATTIVSNYSFKLRGDFKAFDANLLSGNVINGTVSGTVGESATVAGNVTAANGIGAILTFDVSGVALTDITAATLNLYLVYNPTSNTPGFTGNLKVLPVSYTGTPVSNNAFSATALSSSTVGFQARIVDPGVDANNPTSGTHGEYYSINIKSLLTAGNAMTVDELGNPKSFSFLIYYPNVNNYNVLFRFNDGDPSNDNAPGNAGLPAKLDLTLAPSSIPEPSGMAVFAGVAAIACVMLRRRRVS